MFQEQLPGRNRHVPAAPNQFVELVENALGVFRFAELSKLLGIGEVKDEYEPIYSRIIPLQAECQRVRLGSMVGDTDTVYSFVSMLRMDLPFDKMS